MHEEDIEGFFSWWENVSEEKECCSGSSIAEERYEFEEFNAGVWNTVLPVRHHFQIQLKERFLVENIWNNN